MKQGYKLSTDWWTTKNASTYCISYLVYNDIQDEMNMYYRKEVGTGEGDGMGWGFATLKDMQATRDIDCMCLLNLSGDETVRELVSSNC